MNRKSEVSSRRKSLVEIDLLKNDLFLGKSFVFVNG